MNQTNIKFISFLGLPASGKGTQAQILAKKNGACVLGIGDLIREEIENANLSDPFCADMRNRYDKGVPQSDEVVLDIVKKNIQRHGSQIIFDNFPFSEKQAELFFKLCKDIQAEKPVLILVKINKDTSLNRILKRRVCSVCESVFIDDGNQICGKCGGALISRTDDNEETLTKRINEYIPRMNEVTQSFVKNGKVIEVDGEGTVNEVSKQISEDLKNANAI